MWAHEILTESSPGQAACGTCGWTAILCHWTGKAQSSARSWSAAGSRGAATRTPAAAGPAAARCTAWTCGGSTSAGELTPDSPISPRPVPYISDSQPGVRVPLGVRKHTAGGTWKHLIITCVTLYFLRIINMGVLMVWQIGSGGTQDKKVWETLPYITAYCSYLADAFIQIDLQLISLSSGQFPLEQCGVRGLAQGPNSCTDLIALTFVVPVERLSHYAKVHLVASELWMPYSVTILNPKVNVLLSS